MSAEEDFTRTLAKERAVQVQDFINAVAICPLPAHVVAIKLDAVFLYDDGMQIAALCDGTQRPKPEEPNAQTPFQT